MSGERPYIGCTISLISKAQNRYEGILYTIDAVNSTVVLAKVMCFGTERRPTDNPVAPKGDVYEYITFRGSDIKDITLCEPLRSHYDLLHDPAIVQSSGVSSTGLYASQAPFSPLKIPSYNQLAASILPSQPYAAVVGLAPVLPSQLARRGPMVEKEVQTVDVEHLKQRRAASAPQSRGLEGGRPHWSRQSGSGTRSAERRTAPYVSSAQEQMPPEGNENGLPQRSRQGAYRRSRVTVGNATSSTLMFETDFDFDSSNAQFVKEELEREMQDRFINKDANSEGKIKAEADSQSETNAEDVLGPKCYYDKGKCFFDHLSSDYNSRGTWAEERKRNVETFGVPGLFVRGRGFRGGWRGRHVVQSYTVQRAGSGQL